MNIDDDTNQVTAVERALNIFELIGSSVTPLTIQEIATQLKIPKASCFRIIKNLVIRDYLAKSYHGSGRYELGYKVLHLAAQANRKLNVREIAINYMWQIVQEHHLVVQLGTLQGETIYLLEQVPPPNNFSPILIHDPLPVNAGAMGKILCAYLPPFQRTSFIQKCEFVQKTVHTIMDRELFLKALEEINKQRFALDMEEYAYGAGCLTMPIFDFHNQCVAALGFTGNIGDYEDETKLAELKRILKEACDQISYRLGNRP
jgi:IclR family KDG regulon transcriptional repressor